MSQLPINEIILFTRLNIPRYTLKIITAIAIFLCLVVNSQAQVSQETIAEKLFGAIVSGSEKDTRLLMKENNIWQEFGSKKFQKSPEVALNHMALYRTAFPDLAIRTKRTLDAGPIVLIQAVLYGTHSGQFQGLLPKGKKLKAEVFYLGYMQDNEIKRSTVYLAPDILALQMKTNQFDNLALSSPPDKPERLRGGKVKINSSIISQIFKASEYVLAARIAGLQGNHALAKKVLGEIDYDQIKLDVDNAKEYTKALPDLNMKLDRIYAAGNYIIVFWIAKGTHRDTLADIRATQRKVNLKLVTIARATKTGIDRVQVYFDESKLISQLR